jgi:transcriptional regulator with XRE-family HTH domain
VDEDVLRERVRHEREIMRNMSIRDAAGRGGISNTTWGEWESGKRKLSRSVRAAVVRAFNWPEDWPINPPAVRPPDPDEPTNAELAQLIGELTTEVARMGAEIETISVLLRAGSTPPDRSTPATRQSPAELR